MKGTVNHEIKDVIGIGNAIVDVLVHENDLFLKNHNVVKGSMTLVDNDYSVNLYEAMESTVEMSGGSVGNTIAGLSALGGKCSYIGKVHDDKLGNIFKHDLKTMGVKFDTLTTTSGSPTARCLVIITPDSQRSMITYLGAAVELDPNDIVEEEIFAHKITFLEGYLWDSPHSKAAAIKAAKIAHDAGRKVALTLSDPLCIERHRESFCEILDNYVDIFFANEFEINSLYQVENFNKALAKLRLVDNLAIITRSEKGSVIVSGEEIHIIDAAPVQQVIDVTGAGDLFAAGVLYGIANSYDLETCGRIGSIVAAEIISHVGARPESDLKELIRKLEY